MQPIIQAFVHLLDPMLRSVHRVQEFTGDPQCMLRVALGFSDRDLQLSDGTWIRRGDPIVELHLWNERVPRMPPEGPDLAWGLRFYRRLVASLRLVAQWMAQHPEARQARALRGETSMVDPARGLIQALGFDLILLERGAKGWRRLRYRMDDFYVWLLMQAYNPGSLRSRPLHQLERVQFWISREAFLRRYGRSRRS
ncbi:hypothetical protein HRbin22_00414 [Candidatus Thermoflexus japonica]|uniref:YkoP-like domain-containing protein n=1 Tax=Candidatus Thermoflexus japonica TaxID=2035417 RepID=A0A2H5Y406_9CHLR|nr:hypothetical protein HRbin22_00414 [Candidatus Thermoflexus japonica]